MPAASALRRRCFRLLAPVHLNPFHASHILGSLWGGSHGNSPSRSPIHHRPLPVRRKHHEPPLDRIAMNIPHLDCWGAPELADVAHVPVVPAAFLPMPRPPRLVRILSARRAPHRGIIRLGTDVLSDPSAGSSGSLCFALLWRPFGAWGCRAGAWTQGGAALCPGLRLWRPFGAWGVSRGAYPGRRCAVPWALVVAPLWGLGCIARRVPGAALRCALGSGCGAPLGLGVYRAARTRGGAALCPGLWL